jgi:transposase
VSTSFQFDPAAHQVTGPVGTLPVAPSDQLARRFLMLLEGECLEENIAAIAQRYGLSRQRYYQLRQDYQEGGAAALTPEKTGPKTNYRRTDQLVRQILRYRYLDPDTSPEVITQKLKQTSFTVSQRTVSRVIADYGLQKKTLRTQPQKRPAPSSYSRRRKTHPSAAGRRRQRGAGSSPTSGG